MPAHELGDTIQEDLPEPSLELTSGMAVEEIEVTVCFKESLLYNV